METTEFYVFLFIHLAGLILGFGSVLVTDLFGLLWILDRVRFPQLIRISGIIEKFIWIGWGLLVAAGIPLIYLKGTIDNLMIIKLFLVGVIAINGYLLHLLHKKLEDYNKLDQIPNVTIFRLTLALIVSQFAWWGSIIIGFAHRHIQTVINWPDRPWLVSGIILATFLIVWAIGEAVFKAKKS